MLQGQCTQTLCSQSSSKQQSMCLLPESSRSSRYYWLYYTSATKDTIRRGERFPNYYTHVLSPQTREPAVLSANPTLGACNGPIGSYGAMIWGHHCPINVERAKPLENRVDADHVNCCALCCIVWYSSKFSYHTGSTTILAKSKWPTFARS